MKAFQERTFSKPIWADRSRKHCRQMFMPYFLLAELSRGKVEVYRRVTDGRTKHEVKETRGHNSVRLRRIPPITVRITYRMIPAW